MFGDQEIHLTATDTVLACAGAIERHRAIDYPLVEAFGLLDFLWVVRVEHNSHMEVTVTHMADDRCGQKGTCHILLRFGDAFGKPRNRDTHISRPELPSLPQGPISIDDVMTGPPKLGTILRLSDPGKIATAMLGGDHL